MLRAVLATIVLAVLAGCSSLPRKSGFEVRSVEPIGRQEPWQNISIRVDMFEEPRGVAVIMVKIPQPVPQYWKEEFVDTNRTYEVMVGKRRIQKPLVREVFRAVVMGSGQTRVYDAVLDSAARVFSVYVPLSEAATARGQSLLILSSDGKWGMTIYGKKVEFEKGFSPDRLPPEFFLDHPSTIKQVIRLNPTTDEFALQGLISLMRTFSQPFTIPERRGEYRGRPDVGMVFAKFTSVEDGLDRLISCTSLKLGPGSAALAPLIGAAYAIQAGVALAQEDCYQPLKLPTMPSPAASDPHNQ